MCWHVRSDNGKWVKAISITMLACVFTCAATASAGATLTQCHHLTHFLCCTSGFSSPSTRFVREEAAWGAKNTQTADKQSATEDRSLGLSLGKCCRQQVRAEVRHGRFWWRMGLAANWLTALSGLKHPKIRFEKLGGATR